MQTELNTAKDEKLVDLDTSGEGGDGGDGDGTEEYTPVCTEPRPQDDLGLGPSGQTDASI